jgi:hypothetical protein
MNNTEENPQKTMSQALTELIEEQGDLIPTLQLVVGAESHEGELVGRFFYGKGEPLVLLGMIDLLQARLEEERGKIRETLDSQRYDSKRTVERKDGKTVVEEEADPAAEDDEECDCPACLIRRDFGHDPEIKSILTGIQREISQTGEPSDKLIRKLRKRIQEMGGPLTEIVRPEKHGPKGAILMGKPTME